MAFLYQNKQETHQSFQADLVCHSDLIPFQSAQATGHICSTHLSMFLPLGFHSAQNVFSHFFIALSHTLARTL